MPSPRKQHYTRIPSVDVVLRDNKFEALLDQYGHASVRDAIRGTLELLRQSLAEGDAVDVGLAAIFIQVKHALDLLMAASLKPVFNLTGTILHTNLGRAPLPDVAVKAMVAAAGTVNLEYDLKTGNRGQRDAHLEGWITRLTGAEAAIVVNNNAAAVLITLNTLALGKDAIVSRGELIEIGGAFRMPDIMQRAGCQLREVGTTNRTHARDFEAAIGPDTGVILKVHTSNYQVYGFTKSVSETGLADLAHGCDVPLVVDLGSGSLVDLERYGLPHETTVRETLENGADLVTFSGDKLLGGPQAGIIAGRADLIERIAKNPMKRAMRLDKITIAALGAVLRLYANPDRLCDHLPTLALLNRSAADIKAQAKRLRPIVATALKTVAKVDIKPSRCQIGSGSLPVDRLDSYTLTLTPRIENDVALRQLSASLRALPQPVICRISNGTVVLDLRALTDEKEFVAQLSLFTG